MAWWFIIGRRKSVELSELFVGECVAVTENPMRVDNNNSSTIQNLASSDEELVGA